MHLIRQRAASVWLILALLLVAPSSAWADNLSFTGTFSGDDQVRLFNFTVSPFSTVTVRTWSYAGGVNAAGDSIADGGFDPVLSLFDSTGSLVDFSDDGLVDDVANDPTTGLALDSYLEIELDAGTYLLALTQSDNFAVGPNFSNGFTRAGEGNFTGGPFLDLAGNQRNGQWAVDILGASQPIPEPATLLLLGTGLAGAAVSRLRRQKKD